MNSVNYRGVKRPVDLAVCLQTALQTAILFLFPLKWTYYIEIDKLIKMSKYVIKNLVYQ